MARLVLKGKFVSRIRDGYPWIYRDWVGSVEGNLSPGDTVEVCSSRGAFLGSAYVNPSSYLMARVYSRKREPLDKELIASRLKDALSLRDALDVNSSAFRVLFSESDGLPGLIVDWYSGVVVFQILTSGLERVRSEVVDAIREVLSPRALVERRDAPGRHLEGLEVEGAVVHYGSRWLDGGRVKIEENGLKFWVDVLSGHKTGHYLDQRENRLEVARLARGRRVLDCFCNTGGFSVYCAAFGAEEVLGIDISERVLELAQENAALNRVEDRVFFAKGNVFDELRTLIKRGRTFDMVILDPPSFTKSKRTLENALRGYKDINVNALKLLSPGGILVTASCSHHVTLELFMGVIREALRDAGRRARVISTRFQAQDHPFLPEVPETLYLKLVILEVR